jgi:hypothetical protein
MMAYNSYYFSPKSGFGLIKTSLSSLTIIKYYGNAGYRGMTAWTAAGRIYAAGCEFNKVDVFDSNLSWLNSYSFPGQCPHSLTIYNSKIFVAIWGNGNVGVITDGSNQVQSFATECPSILSSISVDFYGYLALSCSGNSQVYIYDSSITYQSKSKGINIFDARLDSNGRFATCWGSSVTIYN